MNLYKGYNNLSFIKKSDLQHIKLKQINFKL